MSGVSGSSPGMLTNSRSNSRFITLELATLTASTLDTFGVRLGFSYSFCSRHACFTWLMSPHIHVTAPIYVGDFVPMKYRTAHSC